MATHCSILAWRIPWTEEPGGLQSMGSQESDMTWQLTYHHHQRVPALCWVGSFLGTGDPAITNTVTDPCPHLEHQF